MNGHTRAHQIDTDCARKEQKRESQVIFVFDYAFIDAIHNQSGYTLLYLELHKVVPLVLYEPYILKRFVRRVQTKESFLH